MRTAMFVPCRPNAADECLCNVHAIHATQVSQLIGQMPQEQFQQLMGMMNAGGAPGGGMGGMGGMPPGAGAGGNVIRLSEEEGAAVGRLTELGFDRTDAAQVRGFWSLNPA